MLDKYRESAAILGLNEMDVDALQVYENMLLEWNEKFNITAITDPEEVEIKHFIDCITPFLTDKIKPSSKLIDVGTGGGFPGMVLKLYDKSLDVTLMDSLNKRIKFLNAVIEELHLEKIEAIHARAEELARNPKYRDSYDIAVSRAVAPLNTLAEYCLPFVRTGGCFIAMKGPEIEEELSYSVRAVEKLRGKFEKTIKVDLPNSDISHSLVVIKKIGPCPKEYPRSGGKPKSKPL